jgi:hypothetical protein
MKDLITVIIPAAVLRDLVAGDAFAFELPDGTRIALACDPDSVKSFREYIDRAMMAHLPAGTNIH